MEPQAQRQSASLDTKRSFRFPNTVLLPQFMIWSHRSRRHFRELIALILPDHCQLCDGSIAARVGGGICADCLAAMPRIDHACSRCGAPVPAVVGPVKDCVHCRDGRWPADQVLAWGIYRDKLREAVVLMKQTGSDPLARSMGLALGQWLKRRLDLPDYDLILSTPKHWLKRVSHQHNSSEILVEQIAAQLKRSYSHRLLIRTRPTAKQGTLMRQARADNVRGAFHVSAPSRVLGKTILVVDDIVTSGATAAEMSSALRKAGTQRVDIVCLARGIGK